MSDLLIDRKYEGIIIIGDYLFNVYPEQYIRLCNKFFGGDVKIVNKER